jgi:hypothetical protein
MSTTDGNSRPASRWRWATPLMAVAFGVAYLLAGWIGDDLEFGVAGLLLMSAFGVGILVAGRFSETVAGLLDRRDERINLIDSQATMFAGMVLLSAVLLGFVVGVARGEDGSPYGMLATIAGLAYVVSLVFLRFRR